MHKKGGSKVVYVVMSISLVLIAAGLLGGLQLAPMFTGSIGTRGGVCDGRLIISSGAYDPIKKSVELRVLYEGNERSIADLFSIVVYPEKRERFNDLSILSPGLNTVIVNNVEPGFSELVLQSNYCSRLQDLWKNQ